MEELKNSNPQETNTENIFLNGQNPIFSFVWDNCKINYLSDKNIFTASITLCGYDYFSPAENEIDARLDLCNMLIKSRYIQKKFTNKSK